MSSIPRNTAPPPSPSRLGWVAALWERLGRSFGGSAPHARAGPSAPAARTAPVPVPVPVPVPRNLRILVADDNPTNLEEACAMLERCGAIVQSAVDGTQAVALARVHDFDLILMDLQMPAMDGVAATMQIRARERARLRPRAPVLAYTSAPLGDDLLRACGIDGVLAKPCSEPALRQCLREWCAA
jgi:two-component system, sensor histidine kinase and response regulator